MTRITTHVLNTSTGLPVAALRVTLDGGEAETDANGRAELGDVPAGVHRLSFKTADLSPLYPTVDIGFVAAGEDHLHLPLLLSPFGYSTYRGS